MTKIITTSWDDGHPLDLRIAELLGKYGLQGTFYIPQRNGPQQMMKERQMQELAAHYEIGGHTLNHVVLDTPDTAVLKTEINGSFDWLTNVVGKLPTSFCFPKGKFTQAALAAVFASGYRLARTTELLSTAAISAGGLMPTSLQVYEHSNITYTKHLLKRAKWKRLLVKMIQYPSTNLVRLTGQYLDTIEKEGGCFHLWGHSWEMEEFGLWGKLEELLKMLGQRKDFLFVSNGQMVRPDEQAGK